jgi:hypothetical protein
MSSAISIGSAGHSQRPTKAKKYCATYIGHNLCMQMARKQSIVQNTFGRSKEWAGIGPDVARLIAKFLIDPRGACQEATCACQVGPSFCRMNRAPKPKLNLQVWHDLSKTYVSEIDAAAGTADSLAASAGDYLTVCACCGLLRSLHGRLGDTEGAS